MTTRLVCAIDDYWCALDHGATFQVRGKPMQRPDLALSRGSFTRALHDGGITVAEVDAADTTASLAAVRKTGYGRSARGRG